MGPLIHLAALNLELPFVTSQAVAAGITRAEAEARGTAAS